MRNITELEVLLESQWEDICEQEQDVLEQIGKLFEQTDRITHYKKSLEKTYKFWFI